MWRPLWIVVLVCAPSDARLGSGYWGRTPGILRTYASDCATEESAVETAVLYSNRSPICRQYIWSAVCFAVQTVSNVDCIAWFLTGVLKFRMVKSARHILADVCWSAGSMVGVVITGRPEMLRS